MMQARIVPRIDLAAFDAQLLDDGGRMRLLPASTLQAFGPDEVASWTGQRSRYGLVTEELVSEVLGGAATSPPADAIEIGAGMGDLGHHLGIHMTDSAVQTRPESRLFYGVVGQPIVDPPPNVERLDAVTAVKRYKPRVVIGSWCTQLYEAGDTPNRVGSSVYGVDEQWLLGQAEVYVHIGNDGPHAKKRIAAVPHSVTYAKWIVSRAADQLLNCVRVWRRRGGQGS